MDVPIYGKWGLGYTLCKGDRVYVLGDGEFGFFPYQHFLRGSAGREFFEKPEHYSHPTFDFLALLEDGVLEYLHPFGGEVLNNFPRFIDILVADFAAGGAVNLALKTKGDMIIINLDLQPTLNATSLTMATRVIRTGFISWSVKRLRNCSILSRRESKKAKIFCSSSSSWLNRVHSAAGRTGRLLVVVDSRSPWWGMEYKRHAFWSLNEDILEITILKTNTPYPSRRYGVSVPALTKRPQKIKDQYAGSEDEVESVENEMASYLASKPSRVGYDTKSLLEQWRESYVDADYDP
ncbi:hypothetical protein Tco_1541640 [Tanacetum coccineum]